MKQERTPGHLMACEMVIENELELGLKKSHVALTYALAMRCENAGRITDWHSINSAIINKWGVKGLERVKNLAHARLEDGGNLDANAAPSSRMNQTTPEGS